MEEPKRTRGQRGPNKVKRKRMYSTSIRLPQYVLDHFDGSTTAMRMALIAHVKGADAT